MNSIEKFIKENKLTFLGKGSGLNSDCCILSGFALYQGYKSSSAVISMIKDVFPRSSDFEEEFKRVFTYAQKKDYGAYWKTDEAKKLYKF